MFKHRHNDLGKSLGYHTVDVVCTEWGEVKVGFGFKIKKIKKNILS